MEKLSIVQELSYYSNLLEKNFIIVFFVMILLILFSYAVFSYIKQYKNLLIEIVFFTKKSIFYLEKNEIKSSSFKVDNIKDVVLNDYQEKDLFYKFLNSIRNLNKTGSITLKKIFNDTFFVSEYTNFERNISLHKDRSVINIKNVFEDIFNMEKVLNAHTDIYKLYNYQTLLISIGIIGTFTGLVLGVYQASDGLTSSDSTEATLALEMLLEGASLAFITSLLGVLTSSILKQIQTYFEHKLLKNLIYLSEVFSVYLPYRSEKWLLFEIRDNAEINHKKVLSYLNKIKDSVKEGDEKLLEYHKLKYNQIHSTLENNTKLEEINNHLNSQIYNELKKLNFSLNKN